jgi:polysaccharide pyruvyl transferase CsaB
VKQPRFTISGYYGFRNAGDEAVLAGLIQAFKAASPGAQPTLTALSIDPDDTRRRHGIASLHRYRAKELIAGIRDCDAFLSGGGSLLQDVTSAHGIYYYLGVVRIAQILGKRTMFAAQGIGPLLRPRTRSLVAGVANRLDAITVRDPESAELLREIGVRRPVQVTADPALLLPGETRAQAGEGPVTISLRSWVQSDQQLPAVLARACSSALPGASLGTLAMQPSQDEQVLEQFRREWHLISGQEATEFAGSGPEIERLPAIVQQIASSRLVIGMRLHALILAAGAGVPAVALAYDPKIQSFMRSTGQEDAVVDLDAGSDAVGAAIARVAGDLPGRTERLRQRIPVLREAAVRNAQVALDLLS